MLLFDLRFSLRTSEAKTGLYSNRGISILFERDTNGTVAQVPLAPSACITAKLGSTRVYITLMVRGCSPAV